jgi:hypothetical protein
MVSDLRLVSDRFRAAKLKIWPNKCLLFSPQIQFCGHIISEEVRCLDVSRTACLDNLQFPYDIHALCRVIGIFSHNRVYTPHFAHILEPLTDMTCKGATLHLHLPLLSLSTNSRTLCVLFLYQLCFAIKGTAD